MPRWNPEVTKENEARAWQLRQRLWTEQRIADELGIHVATVSRMLDRVERKLAEQLAEEALPIKAHQTAQLQEIAAQAFAAWEQSKLDAELERIVTEEVNLVGDEEGDGVSIPAVKVKTTNERKGQTGDPALLEKAMKALEGIRSIWGLDAPKAPPEPPPAGDGGTVTIREVIVQLPSIAPEIPASVTMSLPATGGGDD